MNEREQIIEVFSLLGEKIREGHIDFDPLAEEIYRSNPWFTPSSVKMAIEAISQRFLLKDSLLNWAKQYPLIKGEPKNVGLVLAGNIPMVGWHDVLSVLVSGHHALIKLSEKDNVLIPFLLQKATDYADLTLNYSLVERLSNFDAVIATGSNNTARYFQNYFSKVPNIIRKNRNSVAILTGEESSSQLELLADDVFMYFGMGCRNISKILVPNEYPMDQLFKAFEKYGVYKEHNKYMNNFDYQYSIALLNRDNFYSNDFFLLKESKAIASPIATLHFEYYDNREKAVNNLINHLEAIQLVISDIQCDVLPCYSFGKAQLPQLEDYADGVDTLSFLCNL